MITKISAASIRASVALAILISSGCALANSPPEEVALKKCVISNGWKMKDIDANPKLIAQHATSKCNEHIEATAKVYKRIYPMLADKSLIYIQNIIYKSAVEALETQIIQFRTR